MADIDAILAGIKTRLATVTGLIAYDHWPSLINTPAAWPKPVSGSYDETQDGEENLNFEVVVAAGNLNDWENAQALLNAYIAKSGTASIKAAIEGDRTLSATVDYVVVHRWRDYGVLEMGSQQFVGVVFELEVYV